MVIISIIEGKIIPSLEKEHPFKKWWKKYLVDDHPK